jgi:antagonist of KipI
MSIEIVKPGLLTTIQDLGRSGYQKYGVIAGGAMDTFAHRVANLLVGNEETEATLEMTVIGPTLYFEEAALIAICGATFTPTIGDTELPLWRPIWVNAKQTIRLGAARSGVRGYLAVAGGFKIPKVMNSYSTYLRAQIGGFEGRALRESDKLFLKDMNVMNQRLIKQLQSLDRKVETHATVSWQVSRALIPKYTSSPVLRVLPGRQYDWFTEESKADLFTGSFIVQPQADRMGYRLKGKSLQLAESAELLSEPVAFGTIQVPADENPIVLMADRQTTGGYPKIAEVISVDLPLLAQTQIGSQIRFERIDMREAQRKRIMLDLNIRLLKQTISIYAQKG